ncbi:MBL fold metallo-hydrolase (plasmid) [Neorhizobium galegae]|nr:MBL fold metallo-hydrolase [Neorhizobium galegae]
MIELRGLAIVNKSPRDQSAPAQADEFAGREQLRASSAEFRKEVIEITDGVFAAVGYSASNVILIQGDIASIIVDTSANPVDARAVMDAFGGRLVRPVRAIIYTHNHPDHSGGATVFSGNDSPEIYSHQTLVESGPEFGRGQRAGGDAFGTTLPDELFINAGTQLRIRPCDAAHAGGLLAADAHLQRREPDDRGGGRPAAARSYAR